jgi:FliI/YscN family ATPase
MIARHTSADVNVIALIGERGREVRDFLERDLGTEGLARSIVVVATSDQAPLLRLRGAYVATTIAEYFRDRGKDVLLLMDSVTRFARARREIGLAAGEPPTTRGFPPSVFEEIPRLLERTGAGETGSVSGFFAVLVEGDDMDEPISDNVRAVLDGHVVLSRALAIVNHYPAIDVLGSISRLAVEVADEPHRKAASAVRETMGIYRQAEEIVSVGAYQSGSNPKLDRAIGMMDEINAYLRQGIEECADYGETVKRLIEISGVEERPKRRRLARAQV